MNTFNWKTLIPYLVAVVAFVVIALAYCSPMLSGKVLRAGDVNNWKGVANEAIEYRTQTGETTWWTNSMFGGMPTYQITGSMPSGKLRKQLENQYAGSKYIEFLGHQNAIQVAELLSKARFSVVSSEWSENNPLSVIESMCAGTPVVGARIGGIPELIDQDNGIAIASGNREDLVTAINQAFSTQWHYSSIKEAAGVRFSLNKHLEQVMEIYGDWFFSY